MWVLAAVREELGDLPGDVVGVGPVVAAATAAALLASRRPRGVVLVGTAGAYEGGPPLGSVVAASLVGLSHGVAEVGLGYVPRPPPPLPADPDLLARFPVAAMSVLTVGAITTDRELARRFSEGWQVEHMEAYGVALACQQAGVPFVACLGITNRVGPEAHAEWVAHRDAVQAAVRRVVAAAISA